MNLYLHNSLTRKEELFVPLDASNVRMYVCGPTVYDKPHIGNARSVVVYDILYRLLNYLYGQEYVNYTRNITDVDDKINVAAKERNITIQTLTSEITNIFHNNIDALNCLRPTIEPRATEHINEMIQIIEELIKNGHAYAINGHVYFSVESDPNYGKLAGRNLSEMIAGARIEVVEEKRHPADFVLWKPADSEDDESSVFDSPWGRGRPGWHIECSAMSSKYLGHDFDIHGGGADLMFPHHTNEIAQSTCAKKDSHFARYWVHNGFLTVSGEKMSKSLGNFITVQELLDQGVKGEVIRYVLMSTHYRKPLDFSDKALLDAKKALDSFYRAIEQIGKLPERVPAEIISSLCKDLNVPEVIAILHEMVGQINKTTDINEKLNLAAKLKLSANFLGLLEQKATEWFGIEDSDWIEEKITLRNQAKKDKNWALADIIRDELKAKGISLEDKPEGTIWRKL
jgi:cysteinyl-tRNA synthetase